MSLEERSQNLLLLDLSKFPFISKGDIRKCIRYNEGEEVAFAENGLYYDVPERLLFLIKPFMLNTSSNITFNKNNVKSVWETRNNRFDCHIKEEFLLKK